MYAASKNTLTGKEILSMFAEVSRLLLLSVLLKFPFASIHLFVDIYKIFRFEPMHCLSLEDEKMLKECIVVMLDDETIVSPSVRCANQNVRPVRSLKHTNLPTLNTFLRQC